MTADSPPLAVEAIGLTKVFGETRAVDGIDLAVARGSVYGVLGPNGAGKTTMVNLFATLLRPDGGTARVLGHDVVAEADTVRGLISLTGQFASVDEDLTARENLTMIARLLGHDRRRARVRADELLGAFGLEGPARKQVKRFSGGMRRRLDIAASLVVTPDLLFLDEPTTGLDPRARRQVWEIVRALAEKGTTIVLCTQYLDEAEQLADRIAVIDHGKVIAEGTPRQLKDSAGSGALRVRVLDPEQSPEARRVLAGALHAEVHVDGDVTALSVACANAGDAAAAVTALEQSGVGVADFALSQPSLDDVFLALTGHTADPGGLSDQDGPAPEDLP